MNLINNITDKRTSEEWQKLHPEVKILDPDGWDRSNWQFSWFEELIEFDEYQKRLAQSTCQWHFSEIEKINQSDIDHLSWMYHRLLAVHKESSTLDYMIKFRKIIEKLENGKN